MASKRKIVGHVDQYGEVHEDGVFAFIPSKNKTFSHLYGDGWMIAAQQAFTYLATDPDIKGAEMKTFSYLMGKLDFQNYILVTQKEIIETTGYTKQSIHKAIETLEKKGIIIVGPKAGRSKTWRLNPEFGYKGNPKGNVRKSRNGQLSLVIDNEK